MTPDHGVRTADLPIAELDLAVDAKLAYAFDFGDEWRVRLTLRGSEESDAAHIRGSSNGMERHRPSTRRGR